MTTVQLRKKVHEIVDTADERLLKMVYAMMNEYEYHDLELTVEEQAELYKRSKELKSGKVKGLTMKELSASVRKNLKK